MLYFLALCNCRFNIFKNDLFHHNYCAQLNNGVWLNCSYIFILVQERWPIIQLKNKTSPFSRHMESYNTPIESSRNSVEKYIKTRNICTKNIVPKSNIFRTRTNTVEKETKTVVNGHFKLDKVNNTEHSFTFTPERIFNPINTRISNMIQDVEKSRQLFNDKHI